MLVRAQPFKIRVLGGLNQVKTHRVFFLFALKLSHVWTHWIITFHHHFHALKLSKSIKPCMFHHVSWLKQCIRAAFSMVHGGSNPPLRRLLAYPGVQGSESSGHSSSLRRKPRKWLEVSSVSAMGRCFSGDFAMGETGKPCETYRDFMRLHHVHQLMMEVYGSIPENILNIWWC